MSGGLAQKPVMTPISFDEWNSTTPSTTPTPTPTATPVAQIVEKVRKKVPEATEVIVIPMKGMAQGGMVTKEEEEGITMPPPVTLPTPPPSPAAPTAEPIVTTPAPVPLTGAQASKEAYLPTATAPTAERVGLEVPAMAQKTAITTQVQQPQYDQKTVTELKGAQKAEELAIQRKAETDVLWERKKAQIEAGISSEKAQQMNALSESLKAAQDDRTDKARKFFDAYDQEVNNLKNIEPTRRSYWELSNTTGKISGLLSIIGASLQSFGGASPEVVNKAVDRIDKAVEDDLQAQRQRYERSKALLADKKAVFQAKYDLAKDYEATLLAKRELIVDDFARRLESELAKIKDPALQEKGKVAVDEALTKLRSSRAQQWMDALKKNTTVTTQVEALPTKTSSREDYLKLLKDMGIKGEGSTKSELQKTTDEMKLLQQVNKALTGSDTERKAGGPLVGQFIAKGLEQGSFTPELRDQMVAAGLLEATKEGIYKVTGDATRFISPERLNIIKSYLEGSVNTSLPRLLEQRDFIRREHGKYFKESPDVILPGFSDFVKATEGVDREMFRKSLGK